MIGLLLLISAAEGRKICRAATFEGGGSHGAYEAGALKTYIENMDPEEVKYDIITGISTGALNTGGLGQFPVGQEKEMSDWIFNFWSSFTSDSQVYKPWNIGIYPSIFFKPSIYDNGPLVDLISKTYSGGFKRRISVSSTNVNTATLHNFHSTELDTDSMISAILCSASPPLYFPPRYFNDTWWADGGCISNLDGFEAINWCLEEVGREKDIILDVFYDYPFPILESESDLSAYNIFKITKNIRDYDKKNWYLYSICLAHPDVNFRYLFLPSEPLPGGHVPLDFSADALSFELNLGMQDTLKMLQNPIKPCETLADITNGSRRRKTIFIED